MATIKREHNAHCEEIARDLRDYSDGLYYRCPECGRSFKLYEEGNYETADQAEDGIEKATCPECGYCSEGYNEFEPLGIFDYLSDCLDIKYICNSNREVEDVKILITFGGPNIWIDTSRSSVDLYWWNEEGHAEIEGYICEDIRETFEEVFNC